MVSWLRRRRRRSNRSPMKCVLGQNCSLRRLKAYEVDYHPPILPRGHLLVLHLVFMLCIAVSSLMIMVRTRSEVGVRFDAFLPHSKNRRTLTHFHVQCLLHSPCFTNTVDNDLTKYTRPSQSSQPPGTYSRFNTMNPFRTMHPQYTEDSAEHASSTQLFQYIPMSLCRPCISMRLQQLS
jgi:hypothetical protein